MLTHMPDLTDALQSSKPAKELLKTVQERLEEMRKTAQAVDLQNFNSQLEEIHRLISCYTETLETIISHRGKFWIQCPVGVC